MEKLNIAGVIYSITWVDKPILDEGCEHWAVLDAENREIKVFNGLSEHDTKHILMHEAAHEIFNMLGIDIEEKFIKLVIRWLFDSVDRNEIFTKEVK